MANESQGLNKLGGISFVISGILFLLKYGLDLVTGPPPANGAEILAWVASGKLPLSLVSEVLFFAAVFLIPAVFALYQSLASIDRAKAVIGCGIIAAVIPIIFVLLIVQGRLVYPVYHLQNRSPAVAELIVSVFYGGLHAIGILLGVATIALSLAMKTSVYGRRLMYLGISTGVFDVIGAYPDRIGPVLIFVSQLSFAAWFLAVGSKLYRIR